jgi:MFS family permease
MMEALIWGYPYTFGLFQEYYSTHEPFASQGNTAVIGTSATGIMYLSSPLAFSALRKWPSIRRTSVIAGLLLMCISLAASSFATSVTQLVLSQGVGYAVGGIMAYSPTILFVNEWFIKRKGLAFGIMWAGTGLAGVLIPLVMKWLLQDFGFRTALRAWATALFVLTAPLLYWVKPRLPVRQSGREHSNRKLFNLSFMLSPQFWILELCNTAEAFGFFLPGIYLPLFAQEKFGADTLASAFTVITINLASTLGCVAMGYLTDRWHVTTCILVSSVGATVSVFLLWGLSTNVATLYVFCVVYGFSAGSFSSTWSGVVTYVQGKVTDSDVGLVFAMLAFGRGVGNVAGGPISEALIKGRTWSGEAGMAYGSGYGPLIVFTGISAMLGGCSFVVRRVGYM